MVESCKQDGLGSMVSCRADTRNALFQSKTRRLVRLIDFLWLASLYPRIREILALFILPSGRIGAMTVE